MALLLQKKSTDDTDGCSFFVCVYSAHRAFRLWLLRNPAQRAFGAGMASLPSTQKAGIAFLRHVTLTPG